MPNQDRKSIISRLRRVEGQIRGLQKMIEEERSCEEVIVQMSAARAALDKVALLIVRRHLADCLVEPDSAQREKSLEKALEMIFRLKT